MPEPSQISASKFKPRQISPTTNIAPKAILGNIASSSSKANLEKQLQRNQNMSLDLEQELKKTITEERANSCHDSILGYGQLSFSDEENFILRSYGQWCIIKTVFLSFMGLLAIISISVSSYIYFSDHNGSAGSISELLNMEFVSSNAYTARQHYENSVSSSSSINPNIPIFLNPYGPEEDIVESILSNCLGLNSAPLMNTKHPMQLVDFYTTKSTCDLPTYSNKNESKLFLYVQNPYIPLISTYNVLKSNNRNLSFQSYLQTGQYKHNILLDALKCKTNNRNKKTLTRSDFLRAKQLILNNFHVIPMTRFESNMKRIMKKFNWNYAHANRCIKQHYHKMLKRVNVEMQNFPFEEDAPLTELDYFDLSLYRHIILNHKA